MEAVMAVSATAGELDASLPQAEARRALTKLKDKAAEATRLVRDLVAQAGSLGITTTELRSAIDEEIKVTER